MVRGKSNFRPANRAGDLKGSDICVVKARGGTRLHPHDHSEMQTAHFLTLPPSIIMSPVEAPGYTSAYYIVKKYREGFKEWP